MRNAIQIGIAGFVIFFLTGCATIATGPGPEVKMRIASNPPGAKVLVDGQERGYTPLIVGLTRADRHRVVISKAGYQDYVQELKPGFNPWVIGNAVIGGIIGLGVDLGTGAVTWLNPPQVEAKMQTAPIVAAPPLVKPTPPPIAGAGGD